VIILIRCFEVADDDDDDVGYNFDLVFHRRQRGAATLAWVLPRAQTGFSACLWLRVSATQTAGTILSLDGSESLLTPHDVLAPNDRHKIAVTVDSRQVGVGVQLCRFYLHYLAVVCHDSSMIIVRFMTKKSKYRNRGVA